MLLHKRIWRRVRWALTSKPRVLRLANGMQIEAPRGGAEALIGYHGCSEPEVAALLAKLLKPGMTFWDVGSHLGEYALIASPLVGEAGRVEAFEPQPGFLNANVARNGLTNVATHDVSIGDQVSCDSATLDAVFEITGAQPDVVVVHVNEAPVLRGSSEVLRSGGATWILRGSEGTAEVLRAFRDAGLFTYWMTPAGLDLILDQPKPKGAQTLVAARGAKP